MSRAFALVLLSLVFGMLIFGCTAKVSAKAWPPVNVAQCDDPSTLPAGHTQEDCYFYFGAAKGNASICGNVQGAAKEDCYYSYALSTDKVAACDLMSGGAKKDDCYTNVGISTKNASVCERISDSTMQKSCMRYSK